jgi:hypothetical protein
MGDRLDIGTLDEQRLVRISAAVEHQDHAALAVVAQRVAAAG